MSVTTTRHHLVRRLCDNEVAIAIDRLDQSLLVTYEGICARTLAGAHARGTAALTKPSSRSRWRTGIERCVTTMRLRVRRRRPDFTGIVTVLAALPWYVAALRPVVINQNMDSW